MLWLPRPAAAAAASTCGAAPLAAPAPFAPPISGLHVEVLEDDRRELRGVLQRGDDARLPVVGVVAQRPVELAGRRPWPEPFADALVAAARRRRGGVHLRRRTSRSSRTIRTC